MVLYEGEPLAQCELDNTAQGLSSFTRQHGNEMRNKCETRRRWNLSDRQCRDLDNFRYTVRGNIFLMEWCFRLLPLCPVYVHSNIAVVARRLAMQTYSVYKKSAQYIIVLLMPVADYVSSSHMEPLLG